MSDMTPAVRKALGLYQPRPPKAGPKPEGIDLESFLPAIQAMAFRLSKTVPVPLDDLVGYGCLGLMDAARRYDPAKGNFRSYLGYRVMGAMRDGVREWGWFSRTQRDFQMRYTEAAGDFPLDPAHDPTQEIYRGLDFGLLVSRVELPERNREMMELYLQGHTTMAQIARQYGLTESRVSQVLSEVEEQLRRAA